ncbi:hypothetical protein A9G11_11110 [Gilliamella sp. wkB108]|uniref:hypothetical protein n=1 Tax=Gilliamella sp. wkB108 TaxID=3120256 RepID=UPI00080DF44F|nr:hypothetical protein [Gilliamella apicola]OCG28354.1 hypothetical protein A9G11_11110 [Gilliamella apicola]
MNSDRKVTISIIKKLIAVVMGCGVIIGIVLLYCDDGKNIYERPVKPENTTMDMTIYPSTIPENQLLRIDEAKKLYQSAFEDQVFYAVVNPDKLIKFIKHAWQWDKNAMPYYYDLMSWQRFYDDNKKEDDMISFKEFMSKYRDQLVDNNGKPLVEPDIYTSLNFRRYLFDKLADLKYPYFAYRKSFFYSPCEYDNKGMLLPCSDSSLEKSIEYLNYALAGGYHCYEYLSAQMLFQQGDHYKDNKFRQLNKLTEYRKSLTSAELKQAIDYTELMAEHSSMIGILRVTEAYLYGLGREHDIVKAYAWSLLLDYAKQKVIENGNNLAWSPTMLPPIWQYNKEIQTRLENMLNTSQKQAAQDYLSTLKTKIIDWNYNRWREQIDDFHPKP